MKTKLFVIFSILISLFTSILGFTTANWNSSPVNVLDDLKTDVQQTALDNAVDISTK
jgi:HAMP domain-containing protein